MTEAVLMNLDDIADFWRCTRRHARDIVVKQPDFPDPAPGSTVKHPVWVRSKVLRFAGLVEEEYAENHA